MDGDSGGSKPSGVRSNLWPLTRVRGVWGGPDLLKAEGGVNQIAVLNSGGLRGVPAALYNLLNPADDPDPDETRRDDWCEGGDP